MYIANEVIFDFQPTVMMQLAYKASENKTEFGHIYVYVSRPAPIMPA